MPDGETGTVQKTVSFKETVDEVVLANRQHRHLSRPRPKITDVLAGSDDEETVDEAQSLRDRFPFPRCTAPGLLIEVLIYIAFLVVFSLVVFNMRDPLFSFLHNDLMKDLLLEEEFPGIEIRKSFEDVATKEEFWEYIQGPLVNGLLADQGAGEGVPYMTNYLVGAVRMRQVRVQMGLCDIHADFLGVIDACYGRYRIGEEDRLPYGPGNAWVYQSCDELGSVCKQYAHHRRYDGGGYVVDFGHQSLADTLTTMQQLQANNWVDLQSRAVFIDFTTYNPAVNLFLVGQIHFEFMPSGGVFPDYKFRVLRLHRYEGSNGTLQLVGEVAIACFVGLFFLEELIQMAVSLYRWRRNKRLVKRGLAPRKSQSYLQDTWNLIDLLNIVFFVVVFVCRYNVDDDFKTMNLVPQNRAMYYDFTRMVLWDAAEKNMLACNAFLLWFKVFKFAVFAPRMGMIAKVVGKAFLPLLAFVCMVLFIIFGFSQAGALAFGSDVEGFDTLSTTLFTMLLTTLGEYDFEALRHSNRVFGPFFFFTFIILVFFIVLSMFLAIVDNAYDEVNEELRRSSEPSVFSKALAWFSTTAVGSKIASALELNKQLEALRREIELGDMNRDGVISRAELDTLMREKAHFFDGTAEEIFEKYDVDNDNQLSASERAQLYADIENEQASIGRKIMSLRESQSEEFRLLFDLLSDRVAKIEQRLETQIKKIRRSVHDIVVDRAPPANTSSTPSAAKPPVGAGVGRIRAQPW